jgi:hypothetical protein
MDGSDGSDGDFVGEMGVGSKRANTLTHAEGSARLSNICVKG